MFRKSAVAAALLLASLPPQLYALGLGEIDMRSALNQPMDAVIELTSPGGARLEDIKVSLASLEAHARLGLSKSAVLADFLFTVERNAAGAPVVRISSDSLIREPYLEFLLELEWSRGRLVRQYTVLVDPPVTMPAAPAVVAAPVSRAATPAPAPRAPATTPVARPVTAPQAATVAPAAASEYGPIRRNETLWSIADRLRPGNDITIEQMMLALQRANPHAFEGDNINRLRAGVTLKVPSRDEILTVGASAARAESRRQYQEWRSGQGVAAAEAATPPGQVEPAAAVAEEAAEEPAEATAEAAAADAPVGESRLQLTAPEAEAVTGTALAGDPRAAAADGATDAEQAEQQLALAAEEIAAERAQSEELQSRVGELEEQIATMQRLLELKDDELARLQQNVAGEAADPAPATEQAEQGAAEREAGTQKAPGATPQPLQQPADAAPQTLAEQAGGLVDRMMQNPLLAGLGALVAVLLGLFVWLSTRGRSRETTLDDEMTLPRQLAESEEPASEALVPDVQVSEPVGEPVTAAEHDVVPDSEDTSDSDPLTEADVYLAYGRIQQAEDVLQAALQSQPDNVKAHEKLLEVYQSAGNTTAFDRTAESFHARFGGDSEQWQKIAAMGLAMSPQNPLYGGSEAVSADDNDFDMDLSGMDDLAAEPAGEASADESRSIEFSMDDEAAEEDELAEGLLESDDEVTTKLDLARAYIDMDDQDSARSILGEVMEEGNAEQKEEAESIIAKLA